MRKFLRGMFQYACDRHATRLNLQVRTADGTGVENLHSSGPTMGLGVSKWIPLPRSRVALYKGYGKTDNGQDIQSSAESHDRNPKPTLRFENANNQNTDTQFWQRNTEEGPGIGEYDPEGGRRDSLG